MKSKKINAKIITYDGPSTKEESGLDNFLKEIEANTEFLKRRIEKTINKRISKSL